MKDITEREDLPYPTAFRIIQTLMHEGLIEREAIGKRYRPTALVQTLSRGYDDAWLRSLSQPLLSELTLQVGWPAMISVHVGMHMVVRAATNRETTLSFFDWQAGCSVPLIGSASGLAWLAQLPTDVADNLVRQRTDAADLSEEEVAVLLDSMEEVRQQGFAWRPAPPSDPNRTASLAAPVKKDGRVVCVLALTYFSAAMTKVTAIERYAETLRETAEKMERQLIEQGH